MTPRRTRSLGVAILVFLSGCAPAMGLGRADTLARGAWRYQGGMDFSVLRADLREDRAAPLPWVQAVTGVHAGVTDRVEVGGRAWAFGWPGAFTTFGLAGDAKYQLHTSRGGADPHLALGASVSWQSPALGNTPWTVLGLTLPVLAGFDIRQSQLVVGPRMALWYVTSQGQRPLFTPGVGAGVGWSGRKGNFEVLPELVWMYAPVGWNGALQDPARTGAHSVHGAIGFAWRHATDR